LLRCLSVSISYRSLAEFRAIKVAAPVFRSQAGIAVDAPRRPVPIARQ
jgi:hypothetical protein